MTNRSEQPSGRSCSVAGPALLIRWCLMAVLAIAVTSVGRADDWPCWMGPERDGVYREDGVIDEVPAAGLPVKWRHEISGGYAGPAFADGRVFVFDYVKQSGDAVNSPGDRPQLTGEERLTALDAATGDVLWEHRYDCAYEISYPAGPRCTPTVDEGRVYSLGSEGDLNCLDVETGDVIWSRSFKRDFGAETPMWGFAGHPLVDGELLYCLVGGTGQGVVAFDKATGEVRWQALDSKAGYAPPRIIEAGGERQLIVFHPQAVESLNPADGSKYWSIPLEPKYEMSIAQPMYDGRLMYASAIGEVSVLAELAKDQAAVKELWRGEIKNAVYSSNSTPMFVDGVIYGTDSGKGSLIAVDATDGSRLWETFAATQPDEERRVNHGTAFLTRLGDTDRYLVFSETGDLIVAELNREGYQEFGRFHVLEPTGEAFGRSVVWSHPAYADRTAFVRNDKEIVAVDLAR